MPEHGKRGRQRFHDGAHLVTVPLSSGTFRALRALTRRGGGNVGDGSVGASLGRIATAHLRNVEIGTREVPKVPAELFVDEGGGP